MYLLSRPFVFLHCLWLSLHTRTRLNPKIYLQSRRAYRLRNKSLEEQLNGRLSEVSSAKSCLNEKAAVIGLVGCAWLDSTSSASAGGEDADRILQGEETDTFLPGSCGPGRRIYICLGTPPDRT